MDNRLGPGLHCYKLAPSRYELTIVWWTEKTSDKQTTLPSFKQSLGLLYFTFESDAIDNFWYHASKVTDRYKELTFIMSYHEQQQTVIITNRDNDTWNKFQYITYVHFYSLKKYNVNANLDASDNVI